MKALLIVASLGIFITQLFGQTDRSIRPRVARTPTPPTIKSDSPNPSAKRPPVLIGQQNPQPQTQPTPPKTDGDDEIIRVETNLVTIPVSVLDRDGRFVSGLRQNDFKIFENGAEQKIELFQSVETPFTVILLIDVSPSTQFQIDEIQNAAIAFVDQLRPADRVMVIAFDQRVHILSHITNNRAILRNAIQRAEFGDGTSLYEAVEHVINRELTQIDGKKAVVMFTDGVDTTSRRANYQSTLMDVEEADALFYPLRYDTQGDMNPGYQYPQRRRKPTFGDMIGILLGGKNIQITGSPPGGSSAEYETGRRYLESLAEKTGGRKFEAKTLGNVNAAFSGIAEELRRQYSLGYYPDKIGTKGERKHIRVRVMRPNFVVKAKTSYIVGQNEAKVAGR